MANWLVSLELKVKEYTVAEDKQLGTSVLIK